MKELINVTTQILITIGIIGMWVTLGKAIWLFFMALSVIAIVVNLINGY